MPITDEQKERKNEMRRLNRARKKEAIPQEEPEEIKEEPEEVEEEPEEIKEDPEEIRKRAIADKRRASLALARSKIKLNSQITKDKDIELTKVKEEILQLKELAKKKEKEAQIIPVVIPKRKAPIRQRPEKVESDYQQPIQQPIQQQQQPSMDYLINQSYAEQLQSRLRSNMIENAMRNTFM